MGVSIALWPRVDDLPPLPPERIVVLSSGIERDSTLDTDGWNRLVEGITLARRYDRPLVTTLVRHADGAPTNRPVVQRAAAQLGPGRWSMTDSVVANTYDEAVKIRAMFPELRRIVLVTSRPHTRRACAVFRKQGFEVTCRSSGHGDWWRILYAYLYEYAAMLEYTLHGRS